MGKKDDVTVRTLLTAAPVQVGLFVVGPVLLACAQLLNSYLNGFPLTASIPFAVVMVAYAVLSARYRRAQHRLAELERTAFAPTAD